MPPRATRFLPSEVPRFVADVRPVETLIEPIAGVGAVIIATCSSPKRDNNAEIVDYHGTRNLIEQPAAADVELVVFISTIYASRRSLPGCGADEPGMEGKGRRGNPRIWNSVLHHPFRLAHGRRWR